MSVNKEQQYSGLYGTYAPGQYYLGDTVIYGGNTQSGKIIWSFRNEQGNLVYVLDDQTGFPFEVVESAVKCKKTGEQ